MLLPNHNRMQRHLESRSARPTAVNVASRQTSCQRHPSYSLHLQPCRAAPSDAPPEQVEEGWLWSIGSKTKAATAAVAELRRENVKAKKSLGQNFLTDDRILADIVFSSGIRAGDLVLEVGPGTGNLTRHLVKTGAQVVAVEKDDYLVTKLEEEFKETPRLKLIHGDITKLDINALLEEMVQQARSPSPPSSPGPPSTSSPSPPPPRLKVVANLPYNITKDFLMLMLPRSDLVSELSIMIQEEVAQRLVTKKTGGKDYRAMSIFTHYYSQPKYRFRIPRAKYYPVPGVDGALVTFMLREQGSRVAVPDEQKYLRLVRTAFNQRRKMLRNSIQSMHAGEQVEEALQFLGLRTDTRAQDLTVEQFAQLAWKLEEIKEQSSNNATATTSAINIGDVATINDDAGDDVAAGDDGDGDADTTTPSSSSSTSGPSSSDGSSSESRQSDDSSRGSSGNASGSSAGARRGDTGSSGDDARTIGSSTAQRKSSKRGSMAKGRRAAAASGRGRS